MQQTDILITGIRGFIAGNLARSLAAAGEKVLGVGRGAPPEETQKSGVRYVPLDITDYAETRRVFAEAQPRLVYHLAATSILHAAAAEGGARAMLETNVAGTWNVLEASRAAGVGAVVVASSDKQYGALATPPYDDEDTTAFQNGGVYELSKAQQDQTARLYAGLYDTPAVRVARLVNIYGPGDTQWTRIIPGTIRRTVRGEAPRVTAGRAGEALREYVFVDDAVTALRRLAADAAALGNTPYRTPEGKLAHVAFNIGPGARLPAAGVVAAVQGVLADEFGVVGPRPEVLPGTPGVFEPGSQFNRTEKLAALFTSGSNAAPFVPRSLADGLRATIPWYLDYLRRETA